MKKYLFFVSHSYAYSVLRPLQKEIWRRGDHVAWFIENTSPVFLKENETHLKTIQEVIDYNPYATFAPGNHIYDFFPGIKVEVFHGLYYKRVNCDEHYKIRGWFDLYCVVSPLFMPTFKKLEQKHGSFKVIETGWSKLDDYLPVPKLKEEGQKPTIIYSSTFTKSIRSVDLFYDEIQSLIKKKDWEWIFAFHPKMDQKILDKYKKLADENENASFYDGEDRVSLYRKADVMLCDSSSVIYEFLWFDKPVVTYKNTFPGNHLIDIDNPDLLAGSIEKALQHPPELMQNIKTFMDKLHPHRDGKSSGRVLDAVDWFDKNHKGKLKKKPLNLIRKFKIRKSVGYFPFRNKINNQQK